MKRFMFISAVLLIAVISIPTAWGKDIIEDAQSLKGENKAYIRADGLACYFCAYGMERFFRKSGKVAAYDMKMKEGIVEITFIKGKPLLAKSELHQIVYDAGYTPRETTYELVGRLKKKDGQYFLHLSETNQSFPIKPGFSLTDHPEKLLGKIVTIKTKVEKLRGNSMLLKPIRLELKSETAAQ